MGEMQSAREKSLHEFRVINRKQMTVDGVKDVVEFDETLVRLLTDGGDMTVEGSELHVKVLDVERGVVALEGKIDGVFYSDSDGGEKKSFWERFLK